MHLSLFHANRRTTLALATLALCGLSCAAMAESSTVKIGALIPLTGSTASDGAWLMRGHELAVAEINARGGIRALGGAKVSLMVGDTQSKPEAGRSETERLIESEHVSALIGAWGSAVTTVAAQSAERSQVPFIITSAISDMLTERGQKYVFRVAPKSKWAADDIGSFIEHLRSVGRQVTKAAVIYEDGPYGQSLSTNYKAMLVAKKTPLVADETFRTGTSDLSTQVSKMRAAGADLVLMGAYVNDSIVLFRALGAQSYKPTVIGYGSGHVQPALLQVGKLVEGSFALAEWMPDLPKESVKNFVAAFEAKYKTTPSPSSAQAYVATWAVAEAMEDAKSAAPDAIRKALASIKRTSGPTTLLPSSDFSFDSTGQLKVGFVGVQVIDGKFVSIWPRELAVQAVASPK